MLSVISDSLTLAAFTGRRAVRSAPPVRTWEIRVPVRRRRHLRVV